MSEYWQKKPLLIRRAAPEYVDRFPVDDLFTLASQEDVESRLVRFARGRWNLERGPFPDLAPADLGRRGWTLLVQGVNLYDDDAAALLERFRFIPDARVDDVMISHAVDGAGVGPHFDSYDVFLLQTHGYRRWRISEQADLSLDATQPMKILQRFAPEQEWLLAPGDMLYLPPHVAHEGVAVGPCSTCSIGFRAPAASEIVAQCLRWMADRIEQRPELAGGFTERFADPEQLPVTHPAALPEALLAFAAEQVARVSWTPDILAESLALGLSEPKSHVYFDAPERPMRESTFAKRASQRGVRMDAKSRVIYAGPAYFINGEQVFEPKAKTRRLLQKLADQRALSASEFVTLTNDSSMVRHCWEWYRAGWLHIV